jgi:hypothetical protein
MFRLIAINFSLLSPTSPCELSEREVTSPSNLKVVRALVYIGGIGNHLCLNFLFIINRESYSIKFLAQTEFDRQAEITKLLLEGVNGAHVRLQNESKTRCKIYVF